LPPPELAGYIIGSPEAADALELYQAQGAGIREAILGLLGDDWSFEGRRVLDFGCGSARVLRQFLDEPGEFHGCDIDADCIAWVDAQLSPPLQVRRIDEQPPFAYPSEHFDLIWTTSVFSHLTDTWSAWLLELRRVLKPGGLLLASVMGRASSQAIAGEDWDPDRIGMTVLGYGRPWDAGGPMVLHSEWWVRAHWGRAFEIVEYAEGAIYGQDAVLMRALPTALTAADLDAPEPDEPRELLAALHAIDLLHREHAELNAAHDGYARAYSAEAAKRAALERELATPVLRRLLGALRR
jgi:SAM-dependent methyltransferase